MSGESPGALEATGIGHFDRGEGEGGGGAGADGIPAFPEFVEHPIPRALRPRLWHGDEIFPQSPTPHSHFTQTFLQSILTSIESKDQAVANAWLDTLLDVFDLLPSTVLQNEILGLTLEKAQLTAQVDARMAAARLLGKLAARFDPVLIQTELLPLAQSLSQDVCPAVRACIARQIQVVAKGLGVEAAKAHLLPGLVELAKDEDQEVKLAALETVVVLTSFLDKDTVKGTILPLILKMCERALRVQDDSLNFLAQHYGKICHSFAGCIRGEEKIPLISYYEQMGRLGLNAYRTADDKESDMTPMPDIVPVFANQTRQLDCRLHCAYNLPAMTLFVQVDNLFASHLQETLALLAADPHRAVRYTVACGIHEVCVLIGSGNQMLWTHFTQLLRDGSSDVIQALVPNLPVAIQGITKGLIDTASESGANEDDESASNTEELLSSLLQCEGSITSRAESGCTWRLHSSFLRTISFLPQYLPHKRTYEIFLPLLFNRMHNARPVPCRESAAYSLLVFLRHSRKREERQDILDKLGREFCEGKSYHKRMLYLKVCEMAASLFSKSYFKNYFFRNALGLTGDEVVNVRIRACGYLPVLKTVLELPKDRTLVTEFEEVLVQIAGKETDRDAREALQTAMSVMDDIPIRLVEEDSGNFDSDGEAEDKRKEAAEKTAHDSGLVGDHRDSRSPDTGSNSESVASGSGSDGRSVSTPISLTVGDSPTNNQPSQPLPSSLPVPTWSSRLRGNTDSRPESSPVEVHNPAPFVRSQPKARSRTPLLSYEASQRLENLDPSTDEFLVDAGVRMNPAAWKPLKPPPNVLPFSAYNDRVPKAAETPMKSSVLVRPENSLRRRQGFGMYFWEGNPSTGPSSSSSSSTGKSSVGLRSSASARQQQQQDKFKQDSQDTRSPVGQPQKKNANGGASSSSKGEATAPPPPPPPLPNHLTRMSTMPELVVARRGGGGGALKTTTVGGSNAGSGMVARRKSAGALGKPSKLRPPSSRISFSGHPGSSPNTSSTESSPISSRSSSPGAGGGGVGVGGSDRMIGAPSSSPFSRAQPHRASTGVLRGGPRGHGSMSPSPGGVGVGVGRFRKPTSASSSPTLQRASVGKAVTPMESGPLKRRPPGQFASGPRQGGVFTGEGGNSNGNGSGSRLPQPRTGTQKQDRVPNSNKPS